MTIRVAVAPPVLTWAISRTDKSVEELKAISEFRRIEQWLSGGVSPTFKQAEKLASEASIPFGYLLLEEPVDDMPKIPDFRTLQGRQRRQFSTNLETTLNDCIRRLAWYVEFAQDNSIEPPEFVGSFTLTSDPVAAALKFRDLFSWPPTEPFKGRKAVAVLADILENNGIIVMRSSVVHNHNQRKLDVAEFRGFSLIQDGFPLIFVNTSDANSAQLFSLAHELGHILLAKPGISNNNDHHDVERWCNKFAAELLVPTEELVAQLAKTSSVESVLSWATDRYRASSEVILWHLVDAGKITRNQAQQYLSEHAHWEKEERKPSGGDFYKTIRTQLGNRFVDALGEAFSDGRITQRDVGRFIGTEKTRALTRIFSED